MVCLLLLLLSLVCDGQHGLRVIGVGAVGAVGAVSRPTTGSENNINSYSGHKCSDRLALL